MSVSENVVPCLTAVFWYQPEEMWKDEVLMLALDAC